jgi:hypothetical protein
VGVPYSNQATGSYSSYAVTARGRWDPYVDPYYYANSFGVYLRIRNGNYGPDGYEGLSGWSCPGGYFGGQPFSQWNTYYTENGSWTAEMKRGLMVHELGHTLGMSHTGSTCKTEPSEPASVMYGYHVWCGTTYPTSWDFLQINNLY